MVNDGILDQMQLPTHIDQISKYLPQIRCWFQEL
jgi:hypothetical protein